MESWRYSPKRSPFHPGSAPLNVVGGTLSKLDCDLQDGGGKVEINPEGKEYMLAACLHVQEPVVAAWQKLDHSIFTVTLMK